MNHYESEHHFSVVHLYLKKATASGTDNRKRRVFRSGHQGHKNQKSEHNLSRERGTCFPMRSYGVLVSPVAQYYSRKRDIVGVPMPILLSDFQTPKLRSLCS